MSIALPIHIIAVVVWLGGLFLLSVVLAPTVRDLDANLARSVWSRTLSRFLVWGSASLILIIATGIVLVNLRFGGFSHMPLVHRWNMMIGLPAIALYAYLHLVAWRRYGRALSRRDSRAAERRAREVRRVMAVIVVLGLAASIVSAAGHYL